MPSVAHGAPQTQHPASITYQNGNMRCAMKARAKAIFEDVRWLPIAMTAMADVVWGPGVRPSGDTLTTTHYREPQGSSLITLVRHGRWVSLTPAL